jgi:hypothetical protein
VTPHQRAALPALEQAWQALQQAPPHRPRSPTDAYRQQTLQFFELLGNALWNMPGYAPAAAARLAGDPARIAALPLAELRGLLTWCVRGERFCDGHWEQLVADGTVQALLARLQALAATPH